MQGESYFNTKLCNCNTKTILPRYACGIEISPFGIRKILWEHFLVFFFDILPLMSALSIPSLGIEIFIPARVVPKFDTQCTKWISSWQCFKCCLSSVVVANHSWSHPSGLLVFVMCMFGSVRFKGQTHSIASCFRDAE